MDGERAVADDFWRVETVHGVDVVGSENVGLGDMPIGRWQDKRQRLGVKQVLVDDADGDLVTVL